MVCPHFCLSTVVLISYSAPWSIQWNGCSSCQGLCLYNAQPDLYFPSSYTENRGYTLCWCSLWPRWPNTLATTLGQNVLLSLQRLMSSMEGRIKDHKWAFPTNKLLLLLLRAMQDSFTHLNLLKTTFTEMRVGVSNFHFVLTLRYYLEFYGFLDYIKIYKPHMDGARPPAESVANCMGTITNIPHIVQDFYTAGLLVWFLWPLTVWDSAVRCNILETVTPLGPANVLCVLTHYPPFPPIFHGFANDPKRHGAFYSYSRMWLVFKDPFGGLKG